MKLKITTIAAVLLFVTGMLHAQPMMQTEPGKLQAKPQMHFAKAGNAPRKTTATGKQQPAVVLSKQAKSTVMKTVASSNVADFEGRTVYGALISSQQWDGYSITQVPYGIYSFTMGVEPTDPVAHITDMTYSFKAGAWGRDRHYGIVPLAMLGVLNGARNITIDTKDWKEKKNVMFDTSHGTYSLIACTMAYNPTDDQFYAYQYKEDLSGLNWVRVNLETDEFEQIAAYRGNTVVLTLAAAPDGTMYYIDVEGDLYTVNKDNGRTSLVGNTGVSPTAFDQCMTYDGRTGTFLWAAQSTEGSVLYSVNPATAETTRVLKFKNNEQFVSLYITDTEAPDNAPAAVSRAQMKYDAEGSLNSTISFTAPSKTYSGATLEGACNLNVWLDGENLKGEDVQPGEKVNISATLTEGNHYVAITVDNEAGFSPMRYIYQYAGYDTPVAPTAVQFAQENGVNTVTWKAPERGVNAGYIDFANLGYDIVRMPDNVTVATGVKELSYSEPTPDAMHSYSYRVIADNNGHKSEYTESNRVLCGNAFTVPYEQQFADPDVLTDYFTVVDNNNDGVTWRQGYTTEVRFDLLPGATDCDDWLISPAIKLEKGNKYRFSMEMKTFTPNYPEDFEILIGTDPADLSTFTLVKREEGFTKIASEFGFYTTDMLIDDTKDYHMAVRYCSKVGNGASLMMIRSFGVSLVGNSAAPAQSSDLVITPDANDELKATVSFKAPTLNLMDDAISSLTAVTVCRDGSAEPVHTFSNPAPGATLSWTDEAVPSVGLHTYTVTAISDAGVGEPLTAEQFIGVYTAPYFTDFEDRHYAELWTTEADINDDPNAWYGWRWTDNENTYGRHMNLYYYNMQDSPVTLWLYTPQFKLEADKVYTINYDASMNNSNYPTVTYEMFKGTAATASEMTELVDVMPSTGWGMESQELILVNEKAGKYNLGMKAHGEKKADYLNASIDNFKLTFRTSAFSPYRMTDYASKADEKAELKATLSFNAPAVNYYNNPLAADENLTVKIYRGQNPTMPTETLSVKPNEKVTWTDEGALHGYNYYMITCENSYGRGELILDTLYVGRDVPELVENYAIHATADNKDAVITWNVPSTGEHGGIVLPEEVTYSVYSYDPVTAELTPIVEGVKENTYTVVNDYSDTQKLHYYAVAAVNTEGEGRALVTNIVLGKVYDLPFQESFAGAVAATQLWQVIPMVQQMTAWGTDNPSDQTYNGCTGPQDEDGGCLYMYNGSQYPVLAGALLVSPKVKLANVEGNELHFWTYNFKESAYSENALVQVAVSANDNAAESVKTVYVGGTKEKGWTENVISLDKYRTNDFLSVAFLGLTGGYMDVIYMDNISIVNPTADGIEHIAADGVSEGKTVKRINYYDVTGREVLMPRDGGVYIKVMTYTDGSQASVKIRK